MNFQNREELGNPQIIACLINTMWETLRNKEHAIVARFREFDTMKAKHKGCDLWGGFSKLAVYIFNYIQGMYIALA